MKIISHIIISTIVGCLMIPYNVHALRASKKISSPLLSINHNNVLDAIAATTPSVTDSDSSLHRQLACTNSFICPGNSIRIPNRQCYDSFNDCECLPGHFKNAQNTACIAQEGLCTQEYVDFVQGEMAELDSLLTMVDDPALNVGLRYSALQSIDLLLPEVLKDYHNGKASCENYVFDGVDLDDIDIQNDGRRHLQLFRGIVDGFKSIGRSIRRVAKKVVNSVVRNVETFVSGVVEVFECATGLINDGAKCGLLGCAFGIGGVAVDIAFTIATKGTTKAKTAEFCPLGGQPVTVVEQIKAVDGVRDTICAANALFNDAVIDLFCEITDFEVALPPVVERFIEGIIEGFCGNPGTAVLSIVEEVVACQIGCADTNNVFCPGGEPAPAPAPQPQPTPPVVAPTPSPTLDPITIFTKKEGFACRTENNGRGTEGKDYIISKSGKSSESQCESVCNGRKGDCQGFEYSKGRCEIWLQKPQKFSHKDGFNCYVKSS